MPDADFFRIFLCSDIIILIYEFRKEQVMRELDEKIITECRAFNRACRGIMTCMYGTDFVVYHFLRGENGFGEKEADKMIDEMMEFLPDNFTKAKKQFYKSICLAPFFSRISRTNMRISR